VKTFFKLTFRFSNPKNVDQKLFSGALILDFDGRDFHSVVYHLVEEFGINDDLCSDVKAEVLRTLLLPHKYVDGHSSNFKLGDLRRSFSRTSFKSIKGVRKRKSTNCLHTIFAFLTLLHFELLYPSYIEE